MNNITEILERNARDFGEDVALVETNGYRMIVGL